MNTNPKKQIRGATLILLTLKMSGSKAVSVVPGPIMSKKPTRGNRDRLPTDIKIKRGAWVISFPVEERVR